MDTIKLSVLGICIFSLMTSFVGSAAVMLIRSKRAAKNKAVERACSKHDCPDIKCSNADGWNLYGSDWGCCGNYNGCCTWASALCYAHDVICQCCDYWLFCGPDCRREPECYGKNETEVVGEDISNGTNISSLNHSDKIPIHKKSSETINETEKKSTASFIHKLRAASKSERNNSQVVENGKKVTKNSKRKPYVKPVMIENLLNEEENITMAYYGIMSDQPQNNDEDPLEGSGEL